MLPDDCKDCYVCGVPVYLSNICDYCAEREEIKEAAAQAVKMYVHDQYGDFLDDVTFEGINSVLMNHGFYIDLYFKEEHDF